MEKKSSIFNFFIWKPILFLLWRKKNEKRDDVTFFFENSKSAESWWVIIVFFLFAKNEQSDKLGIFTALQSVQFLRGS